MASIQHPQKTQQAISMNSSCSEESSLECNKAQPRGDIHDPWMKPCFLKLNTSKLSPHEFESETGQLIN
jgi:hypothetical protein